MPAVYPSSLQVGATAGIVSSAWPVAGTTSDSRQYSQREQFPPRVLPFSVQVGLTASISVTISWPSAGISLPPDR